ncbi:MAG: glycine cleavage system aminomethyltransferase GcvT [Alphaproteobacteria bacterium]
MASRTPLFDFHQRHKARMVDFADYQLPIHYAAGIIAEHHATRQSAALFDVSHMGQTRISGAGVTRLLAQLLPLLPEAIPIGAMRYSFILTPSGGIVDDLILARIREDEFILVFNASRKQRDREVLHELINTPEHKAECKVEHLDESHALLALQGPNAAAVLAALVAPTTPANESSSPADLNFMETRQFTLNIHHDGGGDGNGNGQKGGQKIPARIARCGYTGEDGFEISIHAAHAESLAETLISSGGSSGRDGAQVALAGLGARDTLRLEAALPLYGHEMDEDISPLEAGLTWAVPKALRTLATLGKGEIGCIGGGALSAALQNPDSLRWRQLALIAEDGPNARRPVRQGATCHKPNSSNSSQLAATADKTGETGVITSGGFSPTLNRTIALARIPRSWQSQPDTPFQVRIRDRSLPFRVAKSPFVEHRYRRR